MSASSTVNVASPAAAQTGYANPSTSQQGVPGGPPVNQSVAANAKQFGLPANPRQNTQAKQTVPPAGTGSIVPQNGTGEVLGGNTAAPTSTGVQTTATSAPTNVAAGASSIPARGTQQGTQRPGLPASPVPNLEFQYWEDPQWPVHPLPQPAYT